MNARSVFTSVLITIFCLGAAVLCRAEDPQAHNSSPQSVDINSLLLPSTVISRHHPETEEDLARAAKVEGLVHKGESVLARGDTDGAIAAFRAALDIDHIRSDAREELGDTLMRVGRYEEAASTYKPFFVHDNHIGYLQTNDISANMKYAVSLYKSGQYSEAWKAYTLGHDLYEKSLAERRGAIPIDIAVTPQNMNTPQLLAASYMVESYGLLINNRYDEAARAIVEAIKIKPSLAVGYLYLGDALKFASAGMCKSFGSSREAFQKAAQLGNGVIKQKALERLGMQ